MNNFKKGLINYGLEKGYIKPSQDQVIFEEQDGLTNYSKPIVEYCFEKVKAEIVLKDLMTA